MVLARLCSVISTTGRRIYLMGYICQFVQQSWTAAQNVHYFRCVHALLRPHPSKTSNNKRVSVFMSERINMTSIILLSDHLPQSFLAHLIAHHDADGLQSFSPHERSTRLTNRSRGQTQIRSPFQILPTAIQPDYRLKEIDMTIAPYTNLSLLYRQAQDTPKISKLWHNFERIPQLSIKVVNAALQNSRILLTNS